MKFNSQVHHRRSIRLKEYDYSQSGHYYMTICTKNRECIFGKIKNREIKLSKLGEIVQKCWNDIPKYYRHVDLDEYVIMPNHIHGVIFVGATFTVAQNESWAGARPAPTIGGIVGSFKSLCVYEWLQYMQQNNINALGKFWQRNYYEHVVRNEKELNTIREYIINNPLQWELDENNPARIFNNHVTNLRKTEHFSKPLATCWQ